MKIRYELNDLDEVAKLILNTATSKTILFNAEMGMGKTTLIKALIKNLGSKDEVSSPTYSLVNEYKLDDDKIYHFDLYRLKSIEEAFDFGIEDYLSSNNWVFIEWPELIKPHLDTSFNEITIKTEDNSLRILNITS